MSIKELLEELMGCEHMGDVTKVVRRLAASVGVGLLGCHGEWEESDWDAIDSLPTKDTRDALLQHSLPWLILERDHAALGDAELERLHVLIRAIKLEGDSDA